MSTTNASAPFVSKSLGDLTKNNKDVNELLLAILRAVESIAAHKFTGRKQGVSHRNFFTCLLLLFLAVTNFYILFSFI